MSVHAESLLVRRVGENVEGGVVRLKKEMVSSGSLHIHLLHNNTIGLK
jgi:hypothetical protein